MKICLFDDDLPSGNNKSVYAIYGDGCLTVEIWERDLMIPRSAGGCFAEMVHFIRLDSANSGRLLSAFPSAQADDPLQGLKDHFSGYNADDDILLFCRQNNIDLLEPEI